MNDHRSRESVARLILVAAQEAVQEGRATAHQVYQYEALGRLSAYRRCLSLMGATAEADEVEQLRRDLHAEIPA